MTMTNREKQKMKINVIAGIFTIITFSVIFGLFCKYVF